MVDEKKSKHFFMSSDKISISIEKPSKLLIFQTLEFQTGVSSRLVSLFLNKCFCFIFFKSLPFLIFIHPNMQI